MNWGAWLRDHRWSRFAIRESRGEEPVLFLAAPVEDGAGDDGVVEDLAPLGQPPVGGDQGGVTPA
jgi:hypothetical protein